MGVRQWSRSSNGANWSKSRAEITRWLVHTRGVSQVFSLHELSPLDGLLEVCDQLRELQDLTSRGARPTDESLQFLQDPNQILQMVELMVGRIDRGMATRSMPAPIEAKATALPLQGAGDILETSSSIKKSMQEKDSRSISAIVPES